jgi:hypothetical protein
VSRLVVLNRSTVDRDQTDLGVTAIRAPRAGTSVMLRAR